MDTLRQQEISKIIGTDRPKPLTDEEIAAFTPEERQAYDTKLRHLKTEAYSYVALIVGLLLILFSIGGAIILGGHGSGSGGTTPVTYPSYFSDEPSTTTTTMYAAYTPEQWDDCLAVHAREHMDPVASAAQCHYDFNQAHAAR